jgi:LysM repeat protein
MRKFALIAALLSGATLLVIATNGTSVQAQTEPQNKQVSSQDAKKPDNKKVTKKTVKKVKVKPGDSLASLAHINKTTWHRMFDANPVVKDPNLIYPNQTLRVPSANEKLTPRAVPGINPTPVAPKITTTYQPRYSHVSNAPAVAGGSVWDQLAACESGGNWQINTGNGFYGGLQFTQGSWNAVGGSGSPANASRQEQIMRGKMLQARQGWGAWPVCSAKIGL